MRIPLAEVKKWKKVFQRGTVKIRTGINSLAPRPYLHSLSIYAKIQESNEWREIPVLTVLMVVDIVVSVILISHDHSGSCISLPHLRCPAPVR